MLTTQSLFARRVLVSLAFLRPHSRAVRLWPWLRPELVLPGK